MYSKLPRDIAPVFQILRNLLLGRKHTGYLRYPEQVAPRTQPPPNLPDGCSHKLANNYYYTRDGRRLVTPDEIVAVNKPSAGTILLSSKSGNKSDKGLTVTQKKPKTPGALYLPPIRGLKTTEETL